MYNGKYTEYNDTTKDYMKNLITMGTLEIPKN